MHCILKYSFISDILRKSADLRDFDKSKIITARWLKTLISEIVCFANCSHAAVGRAYQKAVYWWWNDKPPASGVSQTVHWFHRKAKTLMHYVLWPKTFNIRNRQQLQQWWFSLFFLTHSRVCTVVYGPTQTTAYARCYTDSSHCQ